jgi:hypothetical protein
MAFYFLFLLILVFALGEANKTLFITSGPPSQIIVLHFVQGGG